MAIRTNGRSASMMPAPHPGTTFIRRRMTTSNCHPRESGDPVTSDSAGRVERQRAELYAQPAATQGDVYWVPPCAGMTGGVSFARLCRIVLPLQLPVGGHLHVGRI